MLRESMRAGGKDVDLSGIKRGFDERLELPHAGLLVEFTEAVVGRDGHARLGRETGLG